MKILILAIGVFFSINLKAQIDTLYQGVLGSSGEVLESANYILNFTIGEAVIETFESNEGFLTQGFHQPEIELVNSIYGKELINGLIRVFPNPTSGEIKVNVEFPKEQYFQINIYDASGKVLKKSNHQLTKGILDFDISQFSSGIYFLEIQIIANRTKQIFEIIKS